MILQCLRGLEARDRDVVIWSDPAKTDVLNELPRIGKVIPELGDDNLHELSLYSYRILYDIQAPDVSVLAVIHKRQEFQAHRKNPGII